MAPTRLEMEVMIQPGCGYLTDKHICDLPNGFIAVDAHFVPVRSVAFFVETSTNAAGYLVETLIFEIITNGSIDPYRALIKASRYVIETFEHLCTSFSSSKLLEPSSYPMVILGSGKKSPLDVKPQLNPLLYRKIQVFELSLPRRVYNTLE